MLMEFLDDEINKKVKEYEQKHKCKVEMYDVQIHKGEVILLNVVSHPIDPSVIAEEVKQLKADFISKVNQLGYNATVIVWKDHV